MGVNRTTRGESFIGVNSGIIISSENLWVRTQTLDSNLLYSPIKTSKFTMVFNFSYMNDSTSMVQFTPIYGIGNLIKYIKKSSDIFHAVEN